MLLLRINIRILFSILFLFRGDVYIWIGFSDISVEGEWKWQDGAKVVFRKWRSDEPNGGERQNCAMLFAYSGKWYAYPCPDPFNYVCKI